VLGRLGSLISPLRQILASIPARSVHAMQALPHRHALPHQRIVTHRRVWAGNGRAHIEVRGVDGPNAETFVKDLEARLERVPGVTWAAVNSIVGRVVVSYDSDAVRLDELVETVEATEEDHGRIDHTERPEHPADTEPQRRQVIALGADLAALTVGVTGRVLRLPKLPTEIAFLPGVVESTPRARRGLEVMLGRPGTDLALSLCNALAQGLSQGPLGLIIDGVNRVSLLTEAIARQRAWQEREAELSGSPDVHRLATTAYPGIEPRPDALPVGPVERHADRAGIASLVGAGLTLAATRDIRRTASVLAAATPKAARLTREGFAARLGRTLAERGVVTMDADVLRRLDRIDTVVVDAELLSTGRYICGGLLVVGGAVDEGVGEPQLRAQVEVLLDPGQPTSVRRQGEWTLGPPDRLGRLRPAASRAMREFRSELRQARQRDAVVLALARGTSVVAVVVAEPEPAPAIDALIAAARSAGKLVIAKAGSRIRPDLAADEQVLGGDQLAESVRKLQADGHAVALVASDAFHALAAADCGIGVCQPERPPPWGAHLICGPGLAQACFVLDAISAAKSATARGVLLATYGSVIGALLAFLGPPAGATERALAAVNLAAAAGWVSGTWTARAVASRPPPVVVEATPWHALPVDQVLRKLNTTRKGLTTAEAAKRLATAPKLLDEVEEPQLLKAFLEELANPLTPTLAAGAAISAAAGSVSDAGLIASVMGINALIGGVQRVSTDRAIRRLARSTAVGVRVRRDGEEVERPASELVPGDVISLQAGDAVPADCRILEANALEIDESALTGESQPVEKSEAPVTAAHIADRSSMLYEGTIVAAGQATVVVVATGADTEAGRSIRVVAEDKPVGGVQARMQSLVRATIPVALGSGAVLLVAGLLRGRPLNQTLSTAVSLAVAAVPEGLPIVATVAQLAAARRLSARNALVRNPPTIETLGRVDILLLDKTGTLTEGRIRLRLVSDGFTEMPVDQLPPSGRVVLGAGLRASPKRVDGVEEPHPTDRAVIDAALQAGVGPDTGTGAWDLVDDVPFESGRGYHAALGRTPTGMRLVVKGAPEVVLPGCVSWRREQVVNPLDGPRRRVIEAAVERFAREGYRVLAVAERAASSREDLTEDRVERLEFLGLLALADQVRPTAAEAVATLREAGVSVGMLTGDHPTTAESIAVELGILGENGEKRVLTGAEIDMMSDAELRSTVPKISVFARVTPAQKVRIVAAYQAQHHTVAMVGDGANDAPAIRLANVGIALGRHSTNAAREAADVVVTDDRIETITDTIIEGRAMWASVRESIGVLLGGNLGEIIFTLGAGLVSAGGSPLNARQLLLVNVFTDILPALALAVRVPPRASPHALLREGPDASLGGRLTRDILQRAAITAASTTGAWWVGRMTGTHARASTIALVTLVGTQLGQTIATGWRSPLVVGASALSGAALVGVVQTPVISHFFGCRPLDPLGWATALGAAGLGTATGVAIGGLGTLAQLANRSPVSGDASAS
jgi:cation-transporting ATPase I